MNKPAPPISPVAAAGRNPHEDGRLRAILDRVVAFVGALTPDGILTEANEPALQAAGMSRADVIGKPFWDTYWWSHDPAVQARLQEAIKTAAQGETVRYEAEIRVADDNRIFIDFQLAPHFAPDGSVAELIPSGIDVTRLKRNEQAARSARNTFADLVNMSPFGVYVVDGDFRLALVGLGARPAFGGIDPLIGRDFAEIMRILWPEPFATEAIDRFRHTLATGESYHAPSTVETRADLGVVESYDWKIERISLHDGSFGVVCHFYDLSEREKYESALRDSEARFRATFENAAVGIGHNAPDGSWLRVNQKLCDILGYTQDEISKLTFQDITHPDDLAADLDLMARVQSGELGEFQIEKRYIRKGGEIVWINLSVGCVRDADGTLEYYIAIVEDISEQKAAQQQEKLLVKELNHRIKNTLATIQAMASHTLRNAKTPEDFRTAFSGRLRAIAAAHDSIFENGAGSAGLKALIRAQLAAYGAGGADRLKISGPDTLLSADRAHGLGLIIHELATNAAKYGALSTDEGVIEIEVQQDGDDILRVLWAENGGPAVAPPKRSGFGSRLIETTIERTMGGTADLDYRPEGLRVAMTFPKSR